MKKRLYNDPISGTTIEQESGGTYVTVYYPPFSRLTMTLTELDVVNLTAVLDTALQPISDIAEFFQSVYHAPEHAARDAAKAFASVASELS